MVEVEETGKGKLTAAFVHMVRIYISSERLKREDEDRGGWVVVRRWAGGDGLASTNL